MPVELQYLDETDEISPTCDLSEFLKTSGGAAFKFTSLPVAKTLTLAQAPGGPIQLPFTTYQALTWDLGEHGNVNFTFVPTVTSVVEIQNSGELFSYNLGDEESDKVSIRVPPGMAYVSVLFNMSLNTSTGASFSAGNFGVCGHVDSQTTFALNFRKAFPSSTPISEAIKQTFESFVFPFHASGAAALNDKDFLDYEFFGRIGGGIGITYGVSGNLLSGRSISEIEQRLSAMNLGTVIVNHLPSYQAGASFAIQYQHADTFRIIAGRQRSASANSLSMCVFRRRDKVVSTSETVGYVLIHPTSSDIVSNLEVSAGKLAASAFSTLVEGPLKKQATSGLTNKLGSNDDGPMKQYLQDVGNVVKNLVTKPENQQFKFAAEQERIQENTALFNYILDFNQPEALSQGYALAAAGNFVDAVQVPGVTLNPGSYLESAFLRKTSATFQFFDIYTAKDVTEYFDRSYLIYAGNGLFRLVVKVGVDDTVTINGKENSCEVYFTAERPSSGTIDPASPVVKLNFTLIDHTSRSAQETVRALHWIGGAPLDAASAQIPADLKGEAKVTCQFSKDAFSRIACDEYSGGHPGPLPHPVDAANYAAFVDAIRGIVPPDNLTNDFLRYFSSYDAWVDFNRVKIDQEGSTRTPDRRQVGTVAASVWPNRWSGIPNSERIGLQCYLYSAQHFMNLCDSLKHLAGDLDAGKFNDNFGLLKKSLDQIIHQNIDVYFMKPAFAALFRSSGSAAGEIRTKAADPNVEISFNAGLARAGLAAG